MTYLKKKKVFVMVIFSSLLIVVAIVLSLIIYSRVSTDIQRFTPRFVDVQGNKYDFEIVLGDKIWVFTQRKLAQNTTTPDFRVFVKSNLNDRNTLHEVFLEETQYKLSDTYIGYRTLNSDLVPDCGVVYRNGKKQKTIKTVLGLPSPSDKWMCNFESPDSLDEARSLGMLE